MLMLATEERKESLIEESSLPHGLGNSEDGTLVRDNVTVKDICGGQQTSGLGNGHCR